MISERDILNRIVTGKFAFAPLQFRLLESELHTGYLDCDALFLASWEGVEVKFAAEIRRYSSERTLLEAIRQAYYVANQLDALPLIITPWLSPEQLERLERERISAIDLSGNGIVTVPGRFLIVRSGNPNLYPDSRTVKNVYEGSSSLVPRSLLLKPIYSSANELLEEVRYRAGSITQSTVSKALKQLEEDVVIWREKGIIKLVQAEKLLDRLAANFDEPFILDSVIGKIDADPLSVAKLVNSSLPPNIKSQLIVTGSSSVNRYATMSREPIVNFYCNSDLQQIIEIINPIFDFTSRFPNLRISLISDPTVFFDPRVDEGVPWASPLQSYVELMNGDNREKETAAQVRKYILKAIDWQGKER